MALQSLTVAAQPDLRLRPWRSINDGVMGGVSRGKIVTVDHGLRFQGLLSLQNNGGFASARRPYGGNSISAGGVRLCVNGDGRRYQFRVRLDHRFDGISWRAGFDTNGTWQTVNLSFGEFEPVYRGRPVSNAGALVTEKIRQIGFMIADKKEGPFQLDFTSIEFPTNE